jgi:hypothetical protein
MQQEMQRKSCLRNCIGVKATSGISEHAACFFSYDIFQLLFIILYPALVSAPLSNILISN